MVTSVKESSRVLVEKRRGSNIEDTCIGITHFAVIYDNVMVCTSIDNTGKEGSRAIVIRHLNNAISLCGQASIAMQDQVLKRKILACELDIEYCTECRRTIIDNGDSAF